MVLPSTEDAPMYRRTEPPSADFDAGGLLPPETRTRCEKSWAGPFHRHALPILLGVEDEFADLFNSEMGRPNRSVSLGRGVLILKDMEDRTDEEVLGNLECDTRYWWAFQMDPRGVHLCQKTLHNFRVKLMEKSKSKLAYREVTDRLIESLAVKVARQRLDSTHILSNFAVLNRLGIFCETLRIFLREVKKVDEKLYETIPAGVRRRHGEGADYHDARREEGARRLTVVARDVFRLVRLFEGNAAVTALAEWKLLTRLFAEQCEVRPDAKGPDSGDEDRGDGEAPVVLKAPKDVSSASLQTPHDPDVTYSGHKGKGYEVQVSETCAEANVAQMITNVEVTRACGSDAKATVPMVEDLSKAGHKPDELVADTGYSSAQNAADLAASDVNLLAPCPAPAKPDPEKEYPPPAEKCPKDREGAAEWLRNQEASPSFPKRYAIRAGGEATNSELKRAHGMRKLRVRGEDRVKLAIYFKALACNLKRALRWWLQCMRPAEGAVALG